MSRNKGMSARRLRPFAETVATTGGAAGPISRNNRALVRTFQIWCLRFLVVGAVLGLWELTARERWFNPLLIGQPSEIAPQFWQLFGSSVVTVDLGVTVEETIIGFVAGSVGGIVFAFILIRFQTLQQALMPLLTALNSLPRIALAPVFILWFGLGPASKIAVSISLVFFILLLNTMAGLSQTDRDLLLLARTVGASEQQRLFKFVLPAAVPVLAAGLELGLIYSFLGAVAAEIIGGESGLGVVLNFDASVFRTDHFFATLLLLAIVTTVATTVMRRVEHRLLRWHYIEMRGARV